MIICRSENGKTSCLNIPEEFQGLLRSFPYAFLSRKILVTEGATEWGIIRRFNEIWNDENFSIAYSYGFIVDWHGGSSAITKAKQQASNFTAIALKKIIELILNVDYMIKSGQMSAENAIHYLIFSIMEIKWKKYLKQLV